MCRWRWVVCMVLGVFLLLGAGCSGGCGSPQGALFPELATDQPNNIVHMDRVGALGRTTTKSILLFVKEVPLPSEFTSTKDGAAKIIDVTIKGDPAFQLRTKLKFPFTIQRGKSNGIKLALDFTPKSEESAEAELLVKCSLCEKVDEDGNFRIRLKYTAPAAKRASLVWGCNGSLHFGDVFQGEAATKTCRLENQGAAPLVVDDVTYKQAPETPAQLFTWAAPGRSFTLQPGDGVDVKVGFAAKPGVAESVKAAFTLVTKTPLLSGSGPLILDVAARTKKPAPRLMLVPVYPGCKRDAECQKIDARLRCDDDDFGATKAKICRVFQTSLPLLKLPYVSKGGKIERSFWVRNIGNAPLKVDGIAFDANASPTLVVKSGSITLPFSLRPKEQKLVYVTYHRTDDKNPHTGNLLVTSNSADNPKAVMLVESAKNGCDIEVTPGKLVFPGPSSKQISIRTRAGTCQVKRVWLEPIKGGDFSLVPEPQANQVLVPNGTFSFLVKFSPKDKQQARWNLKIESDDPDSPVVTVPLESVTDPAWCELAVTPSALNFGLVPPGQRRIEPLILQNKGSGDCDIKSLRVVGTSPAGSTPFQLERKFVGPAKVGAGAQQRYGVLFAPLVAGGFTGEVQIESSDAKKSRWVIKLQGTSKQPCLAIAPPNLDFGATKFGCATKTQLVTLYHTGLASCQKLISVSNVQLVNNASGEFRLNKAPQLPVSVQVGRSVDVSLSYKARDLGVDKATLSVVNDVVGQSPVTAALIGEGVSTTEQKDLFKQAKSPVSDVLFVVDDSGSTAHEQSLLASNVSSFLQFATRLKADFHIMVTTTDLTSARFKPGCARGATPIITGKTPDPGKALAANFRVGTSGSGLEQGLEAAYQALSPVATNGCNKGFYRAGASLDVVIVSDEEDGSSRPVQFYVRFFQNLKGTRSANNVRFSAIVGPPGGCRSSAGGSAQAGLRYWETAKKTGGLQASVCASDWKQIMSDLGKRAFSMRTHFTLSRYADEKTIVVKVNGAVVSKSQQNGWSFQVAENTLVFAGAGIPPAGATVEIQYKAICFP